MQIQMSKNKSLGFTLIEILVAISIFSILSALAYGTLNQTLLTANALSERMDRIQSLQRTMRLIEQDFMQLAERPIRSEIGDTYLAALTTHPSNTYPIEFTRHGWNNPLTLNRSTLQRVAYETIDGKLIRYHWNVLDKTYTNQIIKDELTNNIEEIRFSFMKEDGEWTDQWPPIEYIADQSLKILPKATRINVNFSDIGQIYRLIEIRP